MHAHDRTLLSSLGFADPDKSSNRHSLACQYLAHPLTAPKIAQCVFCKEEREEWWKVGKDGRYCMTEHADQYLKAELTRHRCEVPVSKGEGRYKTTVGFLDSLLEYSVTFNRSTRSRVSVEKAASEHRCPADTQWGDWHDGGVSTFTSQRQVVVEVKITPVNADQVIRQIALYREYLPTGCTFALVADFPILDVEAAMLSNARIRWIALGANFDSYCDMNERQDATPALYI